MKLEDNRRLIARAVARAWLDDEYRDRLRSDPREVLTEEGIEVPADLTVVFHEDTPEVHHLVLRKRPPDIPPEDLEEYAHDLLTACICFTAVGH